MSKSSHTHISFQTCHKNTAGKSATHHLIDVNILFSHLGSIALLADNFWPILAILAILTLLLQACLLTWGPLPRLPTKEQQPQGLSVNTIQLGCSDVRSTNCWTTWWWWWWWWWEMFLWNMIDADKDHLDASVVLPVPHGLFEQCLVHLNNNFV